MGKGQNEGALRQKSSEDGGRISSLPSCALWGQALWCGRVGMG